MKTFILTLVIVLNLESATFKFKDGTVVNGNIFERPHSLGNASPKGILLIVNNKIYIHNYPLKTREKIIDHGNGTYTITRRNNSYSLLHPKEVLTLTNCQRVCQPESILFILPLKP